MQPISFGWQTSTYNRPNEVTQTKSSKRERFIKPYTKIYGSNSRTSWQSDSKLSDCHSIAPMYRLPTLPIPDPQALTEKKKYT